MQSDEELDLEDEEIYAPTDGRDFWIGYLPYMAMMAVGLFLHWKGHAIGGIICGVGIVYLGGYYLRHAEGKDRIWVAVYRLLCLLGLAVCICFLIAGLS